MASFTVTHQAGARAEDEVYSVLHKYTRHVYRNCRVESMYTKTGNTEIDIIAALADMVLVIEVKNIRKIEGELPFKSWVLEGKDAGQAYTAMNIFTQNRIHVRSLKDAWFKVRKEFPVVLSVVVVPNGCDIPQALRDKGILEVGELESQIVSVACNYENREPKYGYTLDFLFGEDGSLLTSVQS